MFCIGTGTVYSLMILCLLLLYFCIVVGAHCASSGTHFVSSGTYSFVSDSIQFASTGTCFLSLGIHVFFCIHWYLFYLQVYSYTVVTVTLLGANEPFMTTVLWLLYWQPYWFKICFDTWITWPVYKYLWILPPSVPPLLISCLPIWSALLGDLL